MSDNIKVVVKVRPLISREIEEKLSYQWRVKNNTLNQLDNNGRECGPPYAFDKVYDEGTNTLDIYNDVAKPIVQAATSGFNGTIFAYGQTSSGKTYTMTGTETSPGIIPLAVYDLFDKIKNIPDRDFLVRVSYLEIYNERLRDLLNVEKKNIKLQESYNGGFKVDWQEHVTTSPEEMLKYLKEGEANRHTGATNMNEESSRSHSIFQITIESREHIEGDEQVGCVNVSTLNLVDLAGSERAGQTGATGLHFKEGTHINMSLSTLALVIKKLSEDQTKYINYRDSKLTRLLQNSLGGNAKTSIICAITPAAVEETISTLQFANRAKAIKNKPEVNAVATNATMIQSLTKQLSKLQSQLEIKKNLEVMLESKKNVEQDNFNLQKQIARLQRLILNGFGQRSSTDMISGAGRKLAQPRRVTISTLHAIDESSVAPLPKFHTPCLKYNPLLIPGSSDFVPIQNTNLLPSISEETDKRLITPPPLGKRVTLNDEVIDLDSDNDESTTLGPNCSPYHKCYESSKTPPCILREKANLAERNLKDIVELTEREKIYTPNVVELIEKLETNATVIIRLQDEMNALQQKGKEKDLEIDQLKVKVTKSNEEIKSISNTKANLEALCEEYTTKLTDVEYCYETLKNKSKKREEELLSLLEEQKISVNRKSNDFCKALQPSNDKELFLMDMSKVSLVNSDNESSVINSNDDETSSHYEDLQIQLTLKSSMILDLESKIKSQKETITDLEQSSQGLQHTIDNLKQKLSLVENENSLLTTSVEGLNSTIKNQKNCLESAQNDIESYNSLIQELQIQLTNKDKNLTLNMTEDTLKNMIANEEKFVANNENMRNVLNSFKLMLESRKSDESLSSDPSLTQINEELKNVIISKDKIIKNFTNDAKLLQDKIDCNIVVIDKLTQDKNNITDAESKVSEKLTSVIEINTELQKIRHESDVKLAALEENNKRLIHTISEKNSLEIELNKRNDALNKQIEALNLKIHNFETELNIKEQAIVTLTENDSRLQQSLSKAKSSMQIIEKILSKLSCEDKIVTCDNSDEDTFVMLEDKLHLIDRKITGVISEKAIDLKNIKDLEEYNNKLTTDLNSLQLEVDSLTKISQYSDTQRAIIEKLTIECKELETMLKSSSLRISELEANEKKIMEENVKFQNEILSKDSRITTLEQKGNLLTADVQKLAQESNDNSKTFKQQIIDLRNFIDVRNKLISEKSAQIVELEQQNRILNEELDNKTSEVTIFTKEINERLENEESKLNCIAHEISNLLETFSSEDLFDDISSLNVYDTIMQNIQRISGYLTRSKLHASNEDNDFDIILAETNSKVIKLKEQNQNLIEKMFDVETKNYLLLRKLDNIKTENQCLNTDFIESEKMLKLLQSELKGNSHDIKNMVQQTESLKKHYDDLNITVLKELDDIGTNVTERSENEKYSNINVNEANSFTETSKQNAINKSLLVDSHEEIISPSSLQKICLNKITDAMQLSDKSLSSTNSDWSFCKPNVCECQQILSQLKSTQEENKFLSNRVNELECNNQFMVNEREEIRRELNLLLEPTFELRKKINSHKTNLSTLTATTYAENRLLKSQVTVLQHHHSRFHNVCQKELPVIKKQLCELLTIFRCDNSFNDKHSDNFKRYSLPSVLFDNISIITNLKNESTLDGDLLMLDTNITMTSADNTFIETDQTCLELPHIYCSSDVACQTNECITDDIGVVNKTNLLENEELTHLLGEYSKTDVQTSPIKINDIDFKCQKCIDFENKLQTLETKIKSVYRELSDVKIQKNEVETKEIPSTDALVRKLHHIELEYDIKNKEISKLSSLLSAKVLELKQIQEENDTLSTQVMENIAETDTLTEELSHIKEQNTTLAEKCFNLEKIIYESKHQEIAVNPTCTQCTAMKNEVHSKLNRSLSDSETSSRFNKLCTLQNELHAGREDCMEITEEVATIKSHLDRSNISISQSIGFDDSMGESNMFSFTKHFETVSPQQNKLNLPRDKQDRLLEIYNSDKIDCLNYYVEKTGVDKENLDCNVKSIDLLKKFYNHFVAKQTNEIENLVNKIKSFEESKNKMEIHVQEINNEYANIKKILYEKEAKIEVVNNTLFKIKQNISVINKEICSSELSDCNNGHLFALFKEKLLKILDDNLQLSSTTIFEKLIDSVVTKHQNDIASIMEQYNTLQVHMETVSLELISVNENLLQMKTQLGEREAEYNLLKDQKEKVHEISNAVTLDIIRKEYELKEIIEKGCQNLIKHHVMPDDVIDFNLPLTQNINLLFEKIISNYKTISAAFKNERDNFKSEINKAKSELDERNKALEAIKEENKNFKQVKDLISANMLSLEEQIRNQLSSYENLNENYEISEKKNNANMAIIEKLHEELNNFKQLALEKEKIILEIKANDINKNTEIIELTNSVKKMNEDIAQMKVVNDIITKEKEYCDTELQKARENLTIKSMELDNLTADILILKDSIKENKSIVNNLQVESKSLWQQNQELKSQLEEKIKECCRLEENIKTNDKSAEIQSKIVLRLQKQKKNDDDTIDEQSRKIAELNLQCSELLSQCEAMKNAAKITNGIEDFVSAKESLEFQLSEGDVEGPKSRVSADAIATTTRRRRQSIHDSSRMFADICGATKNNAGNTSLPTSNSRWSSLTSVDSILTSTPSTNILKVSAHIWDRKGIVTVSPRAVQNDHTRAEAVFDARPKPLDLFMDVDDSSNRSTPLRTNRRRDSISHLESDKEEEIGSRPSSVLNNRRKRQSTHDLHRTSLIESLGRSSSRQSSSPILKSVDNENNVSGQSEIAQLRECLSSCQQELEKLKESYRELDEECETCSKYLQERDDQCSKLKKDKRALETMVAELKEKLQSTNPNKSQQEPKRCFSDAAANTDEDWANLHSVVVDRMSYDAEVEKNKRLTKIIEDLRIKKQDLQNTLTKMQNAMQRHGIKASSRELESTKSELKACQQELEKLKEKYRELDEECETCSEYLRERDQQCRALEKAKAALEAKLAAHQESSGSLSSLRNKRHSLHDQNRDAITEVSDDLLSHQVERDDDPQSKELRRLKMAMDKLSQQKADLEKQLSSNSSSAPKPMYIATGSAIVQNQQLTDVMQENQKLKKVNAKLVQICKKRGKKAEMENVEV